MTPGHVRIDGEKFSLLVLGFFFVSELHLDKAETSSFIGLPVSHDYGIGHNSELFKVLDEICLLGLES